MSSKQINFFIAPKELTKISSFLFDRKCKILKRVRDKSDSLMNYDIEKNPEKIFQVYLSSEEYKEKLFYEDINSKDACYIDILRSYCIEFSIGGFYPYSNKELHSSRFYYVFEYYENGKMIQKDKMFINWADDIINTFKKQFLRKASIYTSNFVTEKFIDWVKENNAEMTVDGTKFIIK